MCKAYLTIDDSPSDRMDELTDFLIKKGIPAIFYCRGDMIEKNRHTALNAIRNGFILVNHTYSHQRAHEKEFDWYIEDIERCETLLKGLYNETGIKQSKKYFRFPHIDRGTAGWLIDYDKAGDENKNILINELMEGVNTPSLERPSTTAFEKKDKIQAYLKKEGYINPFKNVTHGWFHEGEMGDARDSLFTFSNNDWMLLERQKGKWPYKTLDDLKQRARRNIYLSKEDSVNVILAHDQAEIVDVTIALIDDMLESSIEFLEV